jgi:hypothetical protein
MAGKTLSILPKPFRLATDTTIAPLSCFVQVAGDDRSESIQVGCKLQYWWTNSRIIS